MAEQTWLDKVYTLMREERLTFGEAASRLGRHGNQVRGRNRRRAAAAVKEQQRMERMGLN